MFGLNRSVWNPKGFQVWFKRSFKRGFKPPFKPNLKPFRVSGFIPPSLKGFGVWFNPPPETLRGHPPLTAPPCSASPRPAHGMCGFRIRQSVHIGFACSRFYRDNQTRFLQCLWDKGSLVFWANRSVGVRSAWPRPDPPPAVRRLDATRPWYVGPSFGFDRFWYAGRFLRIHFSGGYFRMHFWRVLRRIRLSSTNQFFELW